MNILDDNFTKKDMKVKYPLYFNLAYFLQIKALKFVHIIEVDPKNQSEEIIDTVLTVSDLYVDPIGIHDNIQKCIYEKHNVNLKQLIVKPTSYDKIVKRILTKHHMFDDELFQEIQTFVRNNY